MAATSSFAPPKLADFILTEKLGSGTYATVFKAYSKDDVDDIAEMSQYLLSYVSARRHGGRGRLSQQHLQMLDGAPAVQTVGTCRGFVETKELKIWTPPLCSRDVEQAELVISLEKVYTIKGYEQEAGGGARNIVNRGRGAVNQSDAPKGDSREVVAVKVVGKKTLNKASMENLLTEIEILKTVRHPHIVQLKDFQWDSENIYLILEWCSGGDLSRFIRGRRLLPESVARRFLQQIAGALQYLHERNISHLDLKPQNILLSGSVLKLADFGFAQYMSPWDEQCVLRGSPLYMAPEMVCRRQYDSRADLWSVGVILYEALFGRAPFASRSYTELEEKIRSDKPIELPAGARVSRDCRDLLLRLLDRNPDTRLTFAQFFCHPFVDLEHMPSADSLGKAKELVVQAVQKDQEGERAAALSLYCSALEHFVPAIHYETDRLRKETLRQKVSQYVSRAEELKALVASDNRQSFEAAKTTRDILREMSSDHPRLLAALQLASTAIAKEQSGLDENISLDLYQQCLGELLLALAAEPQGRRRELLHGEIKSLMTRAEYLKEQIKMQETQKDVASLAREPLSESARSSCCLQ